MSGKTWMVRAGRGGRSLEGFLENNLIAIGFDLEQSLEKMRSRETISLTPRSLRRPVRPSLIHFSFIGE